MADASGHGLLAEAAYAGGRGWGRADQDSALSGTPLTAAGYGQVRADSLGEIPLPAQTAMVRAGKGW